MNAFMRCDAVQQTIKSRPFTLAAFYCLLRRLGVPVLLLQLLHLVFDVKRPPQIMGRSRLLCDLKRRPACDLVKTAPLGVDRFKLQG